MDYCSGVEDLGLNLVFLIVCKTRGKKVTQKAIQASVARGFITRRSSV